MTTPNPVDALMEQEFEVWALKAGHAFRDEQHGVCWYEGGARTRQWQGYKAGAEASASALAAMPAPSAEPFCANPAQPCEYQCQECRKVDFDKPAQQAGGVPAGFVVVPVDMDINMEIAFCEVWFSKRRAIDDPEMQDAWAAALAATPPVQPRVVDKSELKRLVSLVFGEEFQITRAVPTIKESLTVEPREPLSEEQINEAWAESAVCRGSLGSRREAFREGARFAEKQAGIVTPKGPTP